mgnify:CR=1 FL=1
MSPCQQREFRLDRQNEFGFHQKGGLCGKGPGIGVQPGAAGFLQPLHGGEQVISVAAECLGSQPGKTGFAVRWIVHLIADAGAGIRVDWRSTLLRKALCQPCQLCCDSLRRQHGAQAIYYSGIAGTPVEQHIRPQGHQRPAKSGLEPQGHSLRGIRVREGGHLRRGGLIKWPELALRCRLRSGGRGKALLPKAGQVLKVSTRGSVILGGRMDAPH